MASALFIRAQTGHLKSAQGSQQTTPNSVTSVSAFSNNLTAFLKGGCSFSSDSSYKSVEASQLTRSTGSLSELPTTSNKVAKVAQKAGVVKLSFGQILKLAFLYLLSAATFFLALPLAIDATTNALEDAFEAARNKADVEANHDSISSQAYQDTDKVFNIKGIDDQLKVMNLLSPIIPAAANSIDGQLDDDDNKGKIKLECKAPTGIDMRTQITTCKALNQLREHRFQQRNQSELEEYVNRQIIGDEVNASVSLNSTDVTNANQLPKPVLSFVASAAFNQGHGPISTIRDGKVEDAMVQAEATVHFNSEQYTGSIAPQLEHVNITIISNNDDSYTVKKAMNYAAKLGDDVVSPNYHHTSTAVIRLSKDKYGYAIDSLVHDISSK